MLDAEIRLRCLELARDLDEDKSFYKFVSESSDIVRNTAAQEVKKQ